MSREFSSICRGKKTARERCPSQMAFLVRALRAPRVSQSSVTAAERDGWQLPYIRYRSWLVHRVPSTRSTCSSFLSLPTANPFSRSREKNTKYEGTIFNGSSLEDNFSTDMYLKILYVFIVICYVVGSDKIALYIP